MGDAVTTGKPTAEELCEQLGQAVDDLAWQTSGKVAGAFQVAVARLDDAVWVLVRLLNEPGVQVYSKHEWECFIAGARAGEFDDLV